MHAGEFSRSGSHDEQDDVVASNANDLENFTKKFLFLVQ